MQSRRTRQKNSKQNGNLLLLKPTSNLKVCFSSFFLFFFFFFFFFFFWGGGGKQKKRSRCFLFLLLLLLLLLFLFVAVVSYCTRIGKEGGGKLCNVYVYRSIVRGNRVSVNIVSYLNKY